MITLKMCYSENVAFSQILGHLGATQLQLQRSFVRFSLKLKVILQSVSYEHFKLFRTSDCCEMLKSSKLNVLILKWPSKCNNYHIFLNIHKETQHYIINVSYTLLSLTYMWVNLDLQLVMSLKLQHSSVTSNFSSYQT